MPELFASIILLGPVFWFSAVAFVAAMILSYSHERYSLTGLIILSGSLVLPYIAGAPIWDFLKEHIIDIISGICVYIAVGAVYAALRFVIFIFELRSRLNEFCKRNNILNGTIPKNKMDDFLRQEGITRVPLRVSDYLDHLAVWALFWPISGLWTLTQKPLKWLFILSQKAITGILQWVSDRAFRDIEVGPSENTDGAGTII